MDKKSYFYHIIPTLLNFLNGTIHIHPFLEFSIIIFRDIKMRTCNKLVSQLCRAWSDCSEVQAGLALYWRQRLITFGSSRIRVKWTCPPFILFGNCPLYNVGDNQDENLQFATQQYRVVVRLHGCEAWPHFNFQHVND